MHIAQYKNNECIGDEFVFQLSKYGFSQDTGAAIASASENNKPYKAYTFVAFSDTLTTQTSCDTAELQCCTIEVVIEGELCTRTCVKRLLTQYATRGQIH